MSQTIWVVIGTSRGIGKGLVEHLSSNPSNYVVAATRKPTDYGKSNVENIVVDQTSEESVKAAVAKVREADVLLLNAAIGAEEQLITTSADRLQEFLATNVVGVHRVVNAFLPALKARKTRKIVLMSSMSGSNEAQIGLHFAFQGPYSVTKAANNMQAVQYHNELHDDGFTIIPIHPGWVATDMGSSVKGIEKMEMQPISIEESVTGLTNVISNLKHEDSAKFFSYDGSKVPW